MRTQSVACDGKYFEDRREAEEHEDKLFEAWLNTPDLTISVADFLLILDDSEEDEYYSTERNLAEGFLRKLFDRSTNEEKV
jgi:hypothetical protein